MSVEYVVTYDQLNIRWLLKCKEYVATRKRNPRFLNSNIVSITIVIMCACLHGFPGVSLSHINATHPCPQTSKLAPKWRNAHHQILHP